MSSFRLFFQRLKFFLFFGIIFGSVFGLYLFYLNYQITTKFEYHRWNLPSRVYSDAVYLFPGQKVSPARLEEKLIRLDYRRVPGGAGTSIQASGEYHRDSRGLLVYLHDFSYPTEEFKGFPIFIRWDGGGSAAGPKVDQILRLDTKESLVTIKLEPELIASVFDEKTEDRTLIKLADIPKSLIDAIVTIEDERFYRHHGIDPQSILRAFLVDLIHGKLVQGGSTLTQQLVKNYFLTGKKSFVRKFNEIIMSLLLERRYTKEEILEAYLNEIYLGQRGAASVAGVGEGAHLFFSKEVSQLTLAESALLAGLIRSPGEYSPFRNPRKAAERRNFVLKEMMEKDLITKREFKEASREKIVLPALRKDLDRAPYFIDLVQAQLKEQFPLEKLRAEGHRIFTTLDLDWQRVAERAVREGLDALEQKIPVVKKRKEEEGKKLEAVLVAVTPQTGYIRAYVGGRDFSKSQFNRPMQAMRQPGSAFKPFVYLTALDPDRSKKSFTLASLLDDSPLTLTTPEGPWSPENYEHDNHGMIPLRTALEKSYNVATVRLALDAGLDQVVETTRLAGIKSPIQPYPSMALGAFEVIPLELASAYTIFPNGGARSETLSVRYLVTKEGEVLEKKGLKIKKVFSAETIYLLNSLLKGVLERGTGASSRALGFQGIAGGKTGTTSDERDAWFVGFTPKVLALVWVGYDDNTPIDMTGAQAALPIWVRFMKEVADAEEDFPQPEKITRVTIDPESGGVATSNCPEKREEPFIKGTEPKESCALHP
ncbi:MAG: PBP1A family penicillin-binding protein [Deltaproteobacteria bacterium]|nr:PBP1A family penicillin-binding protein [Deltaproteobacteria bacterium]